MWGRYNLTRHMAQVKLIDRVCEIHLNAVHLSHRSQDSILKMFQRAPNFVFTGLKEWESLRRLHISIWNGCLDKDFYLTGFEYLHCKISLKPASLKAIWYIKWGFINQQQSTAIIFIFFQPSSTHIHINFNPMIHVGGVTHLYLLAPTSESSTLTKR